MDPNNSFQELIDESITRFCSELNGKPVELYEPLRYILSLGGKRIRPLLTLLACDLFDGDVEAALHPAMGLELFHNFSLIHDDIMDHAPLRRNKPTIHKKWSPEVAILSGDAMLVKAYQLVCRTGRKGLMPERILKVLEVFNETALAVCEGQQLDMNYEKLETVSIPQYLKMTELKTAALIAACLKIGALIAGARPEDAERIYEFGKNAGIAFQLQDDILDAYGSEDKFGKQKGGDIIANKKTFLLLKALELSRQNAYKKEELQQWIYAPVVDARQKVEAVTAIYDYLNVRQLAEEEMMSFYNKGLSFLEKIPASENKKAELKKLIDTLIKRLC